LRQLPRTAAAYLITIVAAAVCFLYALTPALEPGPATIALAAVPVLIAARTFLFRVSHTTRVSLYASVAFALVLIVGAPAAAWAGAISTVIAALLPTRERMTWYQVAFNAANRTVSLAISGSAYLLISGGQPLLGGRASAEAILAAALFFFILNVGLLAAMVSLVRNGGESLHHWIVSFRAIAVEYVCLLAMGLLLAAMWEYAPAGLPLSIVPMTALVLVLRARLTVQLETKRAFEDLADEVDKRDPYTIGRSVRVAQYCQRIIQAFPEMSPQRAELIVWSARIHDIGRKYLVPSVVARPGRLERWEEQEMRMHANYGADLVRAVPGMRTAAELILHHHENVDGTGYPAGLRGDAIPLGSRVIRVADAFDAMTSPRPYRPAMTIEDAAEELRANRGAQFDPLIVEALLRQIRPEDVTAALPSALPAEEPSVVAPPLAPAPWVVLA
jgi:HD-GYP domain-containing protein (c-di-GMP phosphodiesterase class II)